LGLSNSLLMNNTLDNDLIVLMGFFIGGTLWAVLMFYGVKNKKGWLYNPKGNNFFGFRYYDFPFLRKKFGEKGVTYYAAFWGVVGIVLPTVVAIYLLFKYR
jgi:hypothetical protein